MNSLLRYLTNVHEVRVMEPLTLLQGFKQLNFEKKSTKYLWLAYKKRLKEIAPSIDFNQLSLLITNLPIFDKNFILFDSLINNLINKSLIGQLDVSRSLINLLKYFKSIQYSNSLFNEYLINHFDQLALSKLNLQLLSDLCNNLDSSTEDFTLKLSNTFNYLIQSTDLDNSTFITLESAAKCLIGLSNLSNILDQDLLLIGNKLLDKLQSHCHLTKLSLLNALITNSNLDFYHNYLDDVLAKISYEGVSNALIVTLLKLSSKINLSKYNFYIDEFIINSLNSNLIIYNGIEVLIPLKLCILINNSNIAIQIIDNMRFGRLSYNEGLLLLDCFYNLKTHFKIDITKSGYLMDYINYQLCYKPQISLFKKLKLGYVEEAKNPIPDELTSTFCYMASIAAEFNESFKSAQSLVISILDNIKLHNIKLTLIDICNILSSLSRLRIRRLDILDHISSHLNQMSIDSEMILKLAKSFAELSYPWVEYSGVVTRGRKYLIAKFKNSNNLNLIRDSSIDSKPNDDYLKINFLYGFAAKNKLFRLSKLINRNLLTMHFNWRYLFKELNSNTNDKALIKLENMLIDNDYKIYKKNVKWKGVFNVDVLAKHDKELIAVNLLLPNDFYTDGTLLPIRRLQLHLLELDIKTLNIHYENVLNYKQNLY